MLYANYGETLYGIILNIVKHEGEAEDVLQESFIKIWQNAEKYDKSKGRLFTWLLNICRNTAIDRLRSSAYKKAQKIRQDDNIVNTIDAEVSESFNPDLIGVKQWIDKLEPAQRLLIDLAYFKGYTQAEIAEEQDIPLGTVKTRIRSAIKKLRELLK